MRKLGILLVTFGTSNSNTFHRGIKHIEQRVMEAFQDQTVYTAFTSSKERQLLQEKSGIKVYSVEESIHRIQEERIHKIVIQPLYIQKGLEYRKMMKEIEDYKDKTIKIIVASPLLEQKSDCEYIIDGLKKVLPRLETNEAIIFMGHGTKHHCGQERILIKNMFMQVGLKNWHMAFLEEQPYIWDIVNIIKQYKYKRIYLTPFLIVVGKHVLKDMVGEKESTWERILINEGYEVEVILRGLGEYEFVSELVIAHIHEAIEEREV